MKHKHYGKFIITAVLALMISTLAGNLYSNNCQAACNLYVRCVGEMNHRQPTADERSKLTAGCMNTCARRPTETLGCYRQAAAAPNSCGQYYTCLLKYTNSR